MDALSHQNGRIVEPVAGNYAANRIAPSGYKTTKRSNPGARRSLTQSLLPDHPIRIYTLGRFSISLQNQTMDFCSKGQRKALELLKTLIAFGGREVGEVRICEALWPDSDGDVAHTTFSVTLHRLRKLLGSETLILSDGRLTLNSDVCWVDSWSVERLIGQIRQMLNSRPISSDKITDLIHKTVALYHGPYLGKEDEQPWFLSYREKLHNKFFRTVLQVCQHLQNNDQCDVAINLYELGLEIDDLSESAYMQLMKCYIKQGKYTEAMRVYQRCDNVLKAHFGLGVSHEMRSLQRSLKQCA